MEIPRKTIPGFKHQLAGMTNLTMLISQHFLRNITLHFETSPRLTVAGFAIIAMFGLLWRKQKLHAASIRHWRPVTVLKGHNQSFRLD